MGVLTITLQGSFGNFRSKTFSAMKVGHAGAIAEALTYLAGEELPRAIRNDHECHKDGIEPIEGFAGKGKILEPTNATTRA